MADLDGVQSQPIAKLRLSENKKIVLPFKRTTTISTQGAGKSSGPNVAGTGVGLNVPTDAAQQNNPAQNVDAVGAPNAEEDEEAEQQPEEEQQPDGALTPGIQEEPGKGDKDYYQAPPNEQANEQAASQEAEQQADQENAGQEQASAEAQQAENAQQAEQAQPATPTPTPADQVKEEAEKVGGKAFITFLYGSIYSIVGIIWALPLLDIYVLAGRFSKNPVLHQLTLWQKIILVVLNIVVVILLIVLIYAIFYTACSGLVGVVVKTVGFFLPQYSFCKDLGF